MSPPAGARANPDVSARLGALEARLDSLEHSQAQTSADAREARDVSKEILVILREQDALAKVAEVKAEATKKVEDLRADVVAANGLIRTELKTVRADVDSLLNLRTQAQGAAKGGKWVLDTLKIVGGAGGATVLIKLLEAWK